MISSSWFETRAQAQMALKKHVKQWAEMDVMGTPGGSPVPSSRYQLEQRLSATLQDGGCLVMWDQRMFLWIHSNNGGYLRGMRCFPTHPFLPVVGS